MTSVFPVRNGSCHLRTRLTGADIAPPDYSEKLERPPIEYRMAFQEIVNHRISTCLVGTIVKNCVMDEDAQQKPEQSVANRVLSMFITAVEKDEALADMATRLKPVLLDGDTVNEVTLRQAIFGGNS